MLLQNDIFSQESFVSVLNIHLGLDICVWMLSDGLRMLLCCLKCNKVVWDEFYTTSGAGVGFDPTQVQSQSQDAIVNSQLDGNFGVRQKFWSTPR